MSVNVLYQTAARATGGRDGSHGERPQLDLERLRAQTKYQVGEQWSGLAGDGHGWCAD